jgi:DNA-directed RNA polymerase alpha subunit
MYITILELYNFLSIDTKLKLLELLNNDLDLIRRRDNIKIREWLDIMQDKKMSVRLYNCLCRGSRYDDIRDKGINDVDEQDIISIRNAGKKCWEEFEKLREEYNESVKK